MKSIQQRVRISHLASTARPCAAILLAAAIAAFSPSAHAQWRDEVIIRSPRMPYGYQLELEPHLVFGTNPPGYGEGSGVGLGVRGSFVIIPEGFLPRVNDTVAIGVGLDIGHYTGSWAFNGYRDYCTHYEIVKDGTPQGARVCTETTSNGGTYNYVYLPAVMQWNFWFTRRWSAFGEPGLNLYYLGSHGINIAPAVYVGGRFHVTDTITITGRLGYPTVSLGASFLM